MTDNLKFLCEQLRAGLADANGFTRWLEAGARSIVFDHVDPAEAFQPGAYIIGGEWKRDLRAVHDMLDQRSRGLLRAGLQQAVDLVASDRQANNPELNGGRNGEHLALTYLSLARDWKCGEVLPCLDALIHSRFPRSEAVYSASVLTWRVLAVFDTSTDWRDVFLPGGHAREEPRFVPVHSVMIVLGMCAAQPRRTAEFLADWPPFQQYLRTLSQSIDRGMADEYTKLMAAYREIRPRIPDVEAFERRSIIGSLYRQQRLMDGDQLPPLADKLRSAHQGAQMSARELGSRTQWVH
jgi:hypothetical protein